MISALAANTILPTRDRPCWEIAQHLQQKLNAEYQAILAELPDPVTEANAVVVSIRDYNAWTNNFGDFPLLCVYRTGSQDQYLDLSDAVAAYYLPSMAVQDEQPGILRWVESRIARALTDYPIWAMGGQDLHANVITTNMRSEYGLGAFPGTDAIAFPFLRVRFQFQEIGV